MNKIERPLIVFSIILAGSLIASALMTKLSPNSSWLAFSGWAVFFIALQLPWLFLKPGALGVCTSWLNLRKK